MQFTDDRDNSSSVGVIDLIFAAAHGWKAGGSSGVTFGSNWPRAAGSTPNRPLTPWPAPLGSQWPEKSICPSGRRGGAPPGGMGLTTYSVVRAFCAPAETDKLSISAAATAAP